MFRNLFASFAVLFLLGAFTLAMTGCENKEEDDNDTDEYVSVECDLPPAIADAVMKAYPGAMLGESEMETMSGGVYYEVEIEQNGREMTVKTTADGRIVEVEEEIDPVSLPEAIRAQVLAKYPDAKFLEAEKVAAGEKVFFVILISTGGKKIEVVVD